MGGRRKRPDDGIRHHPVAHRSADAVEAQAAGAVERFELPKHDQTMAQRTDGRGTEMKTSDECRVTGDGKSDECRVTNGKGSGESIQCSVFSVQSPMAGTNMGTLWKASLPTKEIRGFT